MSERIDIRHGDCRAILGTLAEASVDSCVTDPPYHLVSIVKRFGAPGAAPAQEGTDGAFRRASAGFMGKTWDGGDVAQDPATWAAVLRVLKPGAHLLAFGGTRTQHRMVCAIEDAGFEIRDQIGWAYGSGFPKSHDVSKGIDKAAGEQGTYGERKPNVHSRGDHKLNEGWKRPWMEDAEAVDKSGREYAPATDAARQWSGWGTALKPAWEPVCVARKPLVGTVAANVQAHGTGALNIDGCRVGTAVETWPASRSYQRAETGGRGQKEYQATGALPSGRWPANLIHDGTDEVRGLVGEAARFFYSAKADKGDRLGSKHPTVKPVDLMAYLCRLVTPPGGVVLDPFAGSGTTGMAALREGFRAILIELEAESVADIKRRIAHVEGGDTPLFAPTEPGLFA